MTIVEIVVQFHLFFAETVLLSSFSFSVCRINISFLNVSLFILMDDGEFEKISNRLRSCFYGVLLDNIHSQNLPNIVKTCAMTKTDKKVRDPSSISKSKTTTVFLARKLPYQRKWGGVERGPFTYTPFCYPNSKRKADEEGIFRHPCLIWLLQ